MYAIGPLKTSNLPPQFVNPMPPTKFVICTCSHCILNSLTNENQQVQNGTFVTNHTHQKHQATDFHQHSQEPILQAITNLNVEEDND
ncbi:hypothetical protein CROQUDRAFT_98970 [Cronartium quercuum f. sp. fusiforme G11]|uniref:Uncharacterized protein n=1 Tax=Cronartium quercuum f. sp. fusiforme G11 TaxID=708437 RepID=A0A9P6NCI5_9BASI|nr:hypothetical protein CROQUDRAFT_98970 [Cronartium quercuum f. sp. fusiforme G11]